MPAKQIRTQEAPIPAAPYSQGVVAGDLIFTAGQIGIDPKTGKVPEGVAEQTRQALENLRATLESVEVTINNVIKTTVFLADMAHYEEMNDVYATYFGETPPARSTIQAKLVKETFKVEIEAVAYIGK